MNQYGRIIIIRPGGIGDAILLIPTIKALKQKYPEAKITVLAEKRNASAFGLCPHIDRVLHYDKPKQLLEAIRGNNDVVIDTEQWHRLSAVVARLTGAPFSVGYATNERRRLFSYPIPYTHDDYEANSFLRLLEPFGIAQSDDTKTPFLVVPAAAKARAESLLNELAGKKFVAVFPGASIPERRWGAVKFSRVADSLAEKGLPVVIVGGKGDEAEGQKIVHENFGLNLAGKTSLAETAAILERSSILLSGDSGVLHIGAGLDIPTVSLFGPGIARKWAPRGDKHIVITRNMVCSPCTRFGYTPKCPIQVKCMQDITVEEVTEAVIQVLNGGFEF
jgi:lipopolysaccharide heptosyltransferase II